MLLLLFFFHCPPCRPERYLTFWFRIRTFLPFCRKRPASRVIFAHNFVNIVRILTHPAGPGGYDMQDTFIIAPFPEIATANIVEIGVFPRGGIGQCARYTLLYAAFRIYPFFGFYLFAHTVSIRKPLPPLRGPYFSWRQEKYGKESRLRKPRFP